MVDGQRHQRALGRVGRTPLPRCRGRRGRPCCGPQGPHVGATGHWAAAAGRARQGHGLRLAERGGDGRDRAVSDSLAFLRCEAERATEGSANTRGAGAAIYRVAWRVRHERALHAWLDRTAGRKRWLADDGHAWRLVGRAPSFNAAYHVLRLLAGGVRGRAQGRARAARVRPHHCAACDSPEVAVVWCSPGVEEDGVAWCTDCRPTDARGLLAAARGGETDSVEECARMAVGQAWTEGHWRRSSHGACPLCGGGEAGGEHLLQWCPAVQAAVDELLPGGGTLAQACHLDTGRDRALCALV